MKKLSTLGLMMVGCALSIQTVAGQVLPPGRQPQGGPPLAFDTTAILVGMPLMERNDVFRELKLTPSQVKVWLKAKPHLFKTYKTTREVAGAQAAAKSLRAALTQKQRDRLYQLQLQCVGTFAFSNDVVPNKIGCTPAQKKKFLDIRMQGLRKFQEEQKREGKAYKPDPKTTRWILETLDAVLTPLQRKKWIALQGKPFKFNPPIRPWQK